MAYVRSLNASSLPISPHRLIGREREQASARDCVLEESVPLLTLTGPGGVGKTRLALAIAADVAARFHDGVVWVDLAQITDPALVAATVAAASRITPAPDKALVDELARVLRPRQTLLLLDNCEHLLAETAALVSALLTQCPALQVLATSRAPLRLRWEQVLAVPPLPLPVGGDGSVDGVARNEAVRLFVERARAVDPAFAITEHNAPVVAALCRKLDGLPLAIELAAARTAVLTPEALTAALTDRLAVLGGGPRDLPARQQTIEATIAWSYALLEPATRALFRRLAVFLGGFTLEGVEVVTPSDVRTSNSAFDGLTTLLEHNLVRRHEGAGEPRFTMLETIRAFGLERLEEAGERVAAQDAHAAYFTALAERLYRAHPGEDHSAERRLRHWSEYPNFQAALAHLVATGDNDAALRFIAAFTSGWHTRMALRDSRRWLEWAVANSADTPTVARGLILSGLAWNLWATGDHEQAQRYGEASLAVGEQLDDLEVRADALEVLGGIALTLHEYERAKPLLEQAVALIHELGERAFEATLLQGLAGVEHGLGDDEAAERHALQALGISRELGTAIGIATTLARLGRLVRDQGNDRAAGLAYHEGLEVCVAAGDRFSLVQQFAGLGEIASRRGQAEIAAVLLGVIDQMAEAAGAIRLPTAGVNYDRATAAARDALGEERFSELRTAGLRLPIDQAVVLARSVRIPAALPSVPDPSWLSASTEAISASDLAQLGLGGERRENPPLDLAALLPAPAAMPELTYREQDVLALICQRQTDAEIAADLFISPRTVASHVSNILAKLGAANRREAAAIAARQGLLRS